MKSIKMFGKSVPLLAIVMITVLSIGAFAASLSYYGQIGTTSQVAQSVLVDGAVQTPALEETFVTTGGNTVAKLHRLTNMAEVLAWLKVNAVHDAEVSVRYDTEIIDDISQFADPPETLMGARSNEVVAIENPDCTLDQLFDVNGLQYTYTVLDGGQYGGASSIMAIIDLENGKHVGIFPGYAGKANDQVCTNTFSDTVASDTGGGAVDVFVWDENYVKLWSSNAQYEAWDYIKEFGSSTGGPCPLTGNEQVLRVSIQHQAAAAMEEDRLESLLCNSVLYDFIQIEEGASFPLGAGQEVYFVIRYTFASNAIESYTITTTVSPSSEP